MCTQATNGWQMTDRQNLIKWPPLLSFLQASSFFAQDCFITPLKKKKNSHSINPQFKSNVWFSVVNFHDIFIYLFFVRSKLFQWPLWIFLSLTEGSTILSACVVQCYTVKHACSTPKWPNGESLLGKGLQIPEGFTSIINIFHPPRVLVQTHAGFFTVIRHQGNPVFLINTLGVNPWAAMWVVLQSITSRAAYLQMALKDRKDSFMDTRAVIDFL